VVCALLGVACSNQETAPQDTVNPAAVNPAAVITVDLDARRQTIDGFGVSTRVWSDPHLSNAAQTVVPLDAQDQILDLLFDDLGLTRVRPIIDAGIEPVNDNADPNLLAPERFTFAGKLTDEHIALVQRVRERGVSTWFPVMLQPEPWMSAHDPAEYVERILAQLIRWKELGALPAFVSPVNEPSGALAGSVSESWLVEVVALLGARLTDAGLSTRIVIPDDIDPTSALRKATAVLNDPNARRFVGALGYHLYGGDPADRQRLKDLAAANGLPLWMTEYSRPEWSSWPAVLEWATTVSELLTDEGVSAVDYLWGFFGSRDAGNSLVSVDFDNGVYRSHRPTAAYWVTGQWSRFVDVGSTRVDAVAASNEIRVSAFVGPDRSKVVIVAVNSGHAALDVQIDLSGGRIGGAVSGTRSSSTETWASVTPLAVTDASLTARLDGQSVTTYVVPLAS
jgi:O-glycosyl hydrolase